VEKQQYRLYLQPAIRKPNHYPEPPPSAREPMGIELYAPEPNPARAYEYHFLP
jgi:hypothetical protein